MRAPPKAAFAAMAAAVAVLAPGSAVGYEPPPVDAGFDYQIGGDYPLPRRASTVVSRDWFSRRRRPAIRPIRSVTSTPSRRRPTSAGADRPDERSNWPPAAGAERSSATTRSWGGEYLVDIRSASQAQRGRRAGSSR